MHSACCPAHLAGQSLKEANLHPEPDPDAHALRQDHATSFGEVAALAWLPLAPVVLAAVARYVVAMQADAEAGVRHLRDQMYSHKSA